MVIFLSISIGLIIVLISLHLIRKEVMKASFFKHVKVNGYDGPLQEDFLTQVQQLESLVDEMNQSFYDIVNDLEGKYSVHEKEIQLLTNRLEEIKYTLDDVQTLMRYQGKAKQTEIKPEKKQLKDMKPKTSNQEALIDEIMQLRANGLDEQQIARRLNKGVREIRMLMSFIR